MGFCKNCNLSIVDDTDHCPFCQCVMDNSTNIDSVRVGIGGYPDAVALTRKFRFVGNLILFLSIVAGLICILIDMQVESEFAWSLVVVLALIYGNTIVQFAIIGRSSYRGKAIILTLMGVLVGYGIDAITGFHAWSVNYVLPGGILFLDFGIIILMIVNHRNWQSYIMSQILMIILSLFMLIFYFVGIITHPLFMQMALAVSILLFIGTIILGDMRARSELRRRFHF